MEDAANIPFGMQMGVEYELGMEGSTGGLATAGAGKVPARGATLATGSAQVKWKDERFYAGVDLVRAAVGSHDPEHEDDAMIGMLLDRFSWDMPKVIERYETSLRRRSELGLAAIKKDILDNQLNETNFPHAAEVARLMPTFASTSQERLDLISTGAGTLMINGQQVEHGNVIGCFELRYGQGDVANAGQSVTVTPEEFALYMTYVTAWRWIECEKYVRTHGDFGFWSLIHDLSCPKGIISLYGRCRSLIGDYISPVEDACAGLFPPMVQKILIINVPRLFAPVWAAVSMFLPQHHKDRIILLSTSNSTVAEIGKYVPEKHLPPHILETKTGA